MRLIGLAVVLSFSLILASLAAEGQQAGKVYRIGYLSPGTPETSRVEPLRQALRELGWIEGQNIAFESRWAGGRDGSRGEPRTAWRQPHRRRRSCG